ncbi:MAG: Yip1 family protein [Methanoregula sp.]|uniref:YIP1 family protein n=1 Tax=Methanoregula sp. TaxID=2052170 RepID=UPI003BAFA421
MISPIVDLLFHPNVFFKNLMTEKENLVPPALIILVIGIFGAASAYLTSILTANMLGTTGFAPSVIIGIAVIFAFFGVFVSWAIISGIFYVISIVFKGNGEFSRSLEIVGYGFIPRIIGSFITLVFALVYLPQVIVPKITQDMLRDPQAVLNATKALMSDPAMVQFYRISMVVTIVFLLWSMVCWICGMKYARQLTLRNAAFCVGIPVILYILYLICAMFLFSALY